MMAPLAKGFPEHISEKANQNMSLHAVLEMVPDRAQDQIAFVDAECGFGLGQLYVSAPKLFAAPIGDVAAHQIAAFAQAWPNRANRRACSIPGEPRHVSRS
jgi:hypothetical protein